MLLIGVIVMRGKPIALNSRVAFRAEGDQVGQGVSGPPVMVEFTPRDNMMNIQGAAQIILGYITVLAGIGVTLTGFVLLPNPVRAAPLLITALPIAMIRPFLPDGRTFIRAKVSSVLATFNNVLSDLDRFATLLASKPRLARFRLTSAATESDIVMFKAVRSYFKSLATELASNLYPFVLALSCTTIRAKAIFTASLLAGERLAADFTNWVGQLNACPKTGRGAKPLAFSVALELFTAHKTEFHRSLIITHSR